MQRTIEQNVLWPCQINSRRDKGSGADGPVDASTGTPGLHNLPPWLQTSQPKPGKQEVQKSRLVGGTQGVRATTTDRWEQQKIWSGAEKRKIERNNGEMLAVCAHMIWLCNIYHGLFLDTFLYWEDWCIWANEHSNTCKQISMRLRCALWGLSQHVLCKANAHPQQPWFITG